MKKLLPLWLLLLCLGSCISADLGMVSLKANRVQMGDSYDQVLAIMGEPNFSSNSPFNDDITYLHYCIFGLAADDANGFFIHKDKTYRRIQNTGRNTREDHGVYEDFSDGVPWNCYGAVKVDWEKIPNPPELLAEQEQSRIRESLMVRRQYLVDGLVIDYTHDGAAQCAQGGVFSIDIAGDVGPDSSFVLEELLKQSPNCIDENGAVVYRTTVSLSSDGGLLVDGYKMGKLFRASGVHTRIDSDIHCASSCAVAYLGGVERSMGERALIIFHSPYIPGLNSRGQRVADCNIGADASIELLEYYQEMTSEEQGQRLMDRTLSYCSASDGWVIQGAAAAELFGIATNAASFKAP